MPSICHDKVTVLWPDFGSVMRFGDVKVRMKKDKKG
jgi:hypothetical protein